MGCKINHYALSLIGAWAVAAGALAVGLHALSGVPALPDAGLHALS